MLAGNFTGVDSINDSSQVPGVPISRYIINNTSMRCHHHSEAAIPSPFSLTCPWRFVVVTVYAIFMTCCSSKRLTIQLSALYFLFPWCQSFLSFIFSC